MKKTILIVAALAVAGIAQAQNIPSGLTGLWRFQDSANKFAATIGTDMTSTVNNAWFSVPWTVIDPGLSDGGGIQTLAYEFLTINHGTAPNGGGSYVNEYTLTMDYRQTSDLGNWNSLYQTAATGRANDGDLWTDNTGDGSAVHIGVGSIGYSTMTYDAGAWHRITLSVDNGSFFKVFVDGVLFLNGAGQAIDGRWSLNPTVHLFADNDWEDRWGIVSTVMFWDHALTDVEVAAMGSSTTPLTFVPEPTTLSLALLGGLVCVLRRSRK